MRLAKIHDPLDLRLCMASWDNMRPGEKVLGLCPFFQIMSHTFLGQDKAKRYTDYIIAVIAVVLTGKY